MNDIIWFVYYNYLNQKNIRGVRYFFPPNFDKYIKRMMSKQNVNNIDLNARSFIEKYKVKNE